MSQNMTLAAAAQAPAGLERCNSLPARRPGPRSLGRAKNIIVPLNEGCARLPFYCVHSLSGKATDYIALARMRGPEQPLYGIQMPVKNRNADFGGAIASLSIPAIADYYREALERFQPSGALALGGWWVDTDRIRDGAAIAQPGTRRPPVCGLRYGTLEQRRRHQPAAFTVSGRPGAQCAALGRRSPAIPARITAVGPQPYSGKSGRDDDRSQKRRSRGNAIWWRSSSTPPNYRRPIWC